MSWLEIVKRFGSSIHNIDYDEKSFIHLYEMILLTTISLLTICDLLYYMNFTFVICVVIIMIRWFYSLSLLCTNRVVAVLNQPVVLCPMIYPWSRNRFSSTLSAFIGINVLVKFYVPGMFTILDPFITKNVLNFTCPFI